MNRPAPTSPTIDADSLKAYRARWDDVAAIEREEQRQKTVAQRLQMLDALLQFALRSGIYKKAIDQKNRDAESVGNHWLILKTSMS
jgi:hypothetical protein